MTTHEIRITRIWCVAQCLQEDLSELFLRAMKMRKTLQAELKKETMSERTSPLQRPSSEGKHEVGGVAVSSSRHLLLQHNIRDCRERMCKVYYHLPRAESPAIAVRLWQGKEAKVIWVPRSSIVRLLPAKMSAVSRVCRVTSTGRTKRSVLFLIFFNWFTLL